MAVAAAALAIAAAPAGASNWSAFTLPSGDVTGPFFGVSCPTESLCVATGSNNAIAASTDPSGGVEAWSLVQLPNLQDIQHEEATASQSLSPGAQIRGISCPAPDFCVAASRQGYIYTSTNPTGGANAWQPTSIDGKGSNTHLHGISCPSTSFCAAVSVEGRIATSTSPAGGPGAWTVTQLPQTYAFQGVSCPSPALCVAVARGGEILGSVNPAAGAGSWQQVGPAGAGELFGISCPSAELCVTGDSYRVFSSTDPVTGPSSWRSAPDATPIRLMGFSCVDTRACAGVIDNGEVITSTNPTGSASDWSFKSVVPFTSANGTFGISCPTRSLCVGVGADYLVIASTDPFADAPSARGRKGRLKRPTVKITKHPRRVVRTRRGTARVSFRFREIGVSDVGFLCKIDRRKFKPCRSPKAYRVGLGRHAFRVKVNQPGGFDQTVTTFKFRVVHVANGRTRGPKRRA